VLLLGAWYLQSRRPASRLGAWHLNRCAEQLLAEASCEWALTLGAAELSQLFADQLISRGWVPCWCGSSASGPQRSWVAALNCVARCRRSLSLPSATWWWRIGPRNVLYSCVLGSCTSVDDAQLYLAFII